MKITILNITLAYYDSETWFELVLEIAQAQYVVTVKVERVKVQDVEIHVCKLGTELWQLINHEQEVGQKITKLIQNLENNQIIEFPVFIEDSSFL